MEEKRERKSAVAVVPAFIPFGFHISDRFKLNSVSLHRIQASTVIQRYRDETPSALQHSLDFCLSRS
jgi:hypothetical protein